MSSIYKTLDARKLIHHISFIKNLNQNNLIIDEDWQEVSNCFAEINPINISSTAMIDNLDFGHVSPLNLFLFKIRFINCIKSNMRIKFRERYFEIKRIINISEMNKILHIIALEI